MNSHKAFHLFSGEMFGAVNYHVGTFESVTFPCEVGWLKVCWLIRFPLETSASQDIFAVRFERCFDLVLFSGMVI